MIWEPKSMYVKRVRAQLGLSQQALATLIGVSRMHVSHLECGNRALTFARELQLECLLRRQGLWPLKR